LLQRELPFMDSAGRNGAKQTNLFGHRSEV
jgi:hypothetical protein